MSGEQQMKRRSLAGRLATLVCVGVLALSGASPAGGEQVEPEVSFEAWYFRAEQQAPIVPIPCTPAPAPCGPVSPGDTTAPQAADGSYVVSSAGGQPGDSDGGGDTGWTAFQWDVFDAVGGTVEEFVVTLTQAPDNRGDFNEPAPGDEPPPIQACNVVSPWAGAPTSNPWVERPTVDCTAAVVPAVEERDGRLTYTFDLTDFARSWVDGSGFGAVVRPGGPDVTAPMAPFQVTFAGYGWQGDNPGLVRPRATFRFSAAPSDLGGDFSGGDLSGGGAGFDTGSFGPAPDIDVFPDDAGSEPLPPGDPLPSTDRAAPPQSPRATPAGTSPGFPAAGWLLVPVALVAIWATGMALGPAGEPALPRQGGVSKLLAARRAERVATDLPQEA